MNAKKFLFIILVFVCGFFLGFALASLGPGFRRGSDRSKLLEQVNNDLNSAISSQREAADRASRLKDELLLVTEYAGKIEEGIGRIEARTGSLEARGGSLAEQLGGIIGESEELRDGIDSASGSLEKSRILLDELGDILLGIQGDS